MAVPESLLWELKPHTRAKHKILREYLKAWIPILGMNHRRIGYIDGFAGPGVYEGGEPGSPVIALRAALMHQERIDEMVFLFIEKRQDRLEHLEEYIGEMVPDQFSVECRPGEFEDEFANVLDDLDSEGQTIAPTFAFIDPFGIKGVPMPLLQRFLSYGRTEVFTNFAVDPANRFKDHPDEKVRNEVRRLLGGEVPTPSPGESNHDALRRTYQNRLEEAAEYVRSFEMYDSQDSPIYDLFFATNHQLGHLKMKEAMWRVDPEGGFRFSDATNPDQMVLFENEPAPQLLELIMREFEGVVTVGEIKDWVAAHTAFLVPHMKGALKIGEEEGRFWVEPEKVDGNSRHGKTFPDGVVIDFTREGPPKPRTLFDL